jgi:diguanylate cyclase (GGDEF)-like protein/PAS domain S-box-containing protein
MGKDTVETPDDSSSSLDALYAINAVSDGIMTVDNQRLVTFMNKAAEALTGWTVREALKKNSDEVFRVINAVTRESDWHPLQAAIQDDERYSLLPNSLLIRKDGTEVAVEDSISPIHDAEGQVTGAAIIFRDVSLSRLMLMKALHRSSHDPLTTLPNRTLLQDRIQQALVGIRHRSYMVAVFYIDVDGFKAVNDHAGHAVGDLLLQAIARRMVACIRSADTLCRARGDEFIVLLSDVGGTESAKRIAGKLLNSMLAAFQIGEKTYSVTLSIGIATCSNPQLDSAILVEQADAAMCRGKQAGGNQAVEFVATEESLLRKRAVLEEELSSALERREFILEYQPQIDLKSRQIVGAEALLRWRTRDHGVQCPISFIPAAERSGLIVPIGQWVLREALRQQKVWRDAGLANLLMSINVSSVEMQQPGYIAALANILKQEQFVPGSLMFELTETVLLQAERETDVLSFLPQMGIQLAIDDFGVGYSNLVYLKRFAVDCIKIDRYFVEHAATRDQDMLLVKAIVGLGKSLGKVLIAEGVETQGQVDILQTLGCDQIQGYFFAKPQSAESFETLLRSGINFRV